jgi:uncharacterized protein (DUF849 family)
MAKQSRIMCVCSIGTNAISKIASGGGLPGAHGHATGSETGIDSRSANPVRTVTSAAYQLPHPRVATLTTGECEDGVDEQGEKEEDDGAAEVGDGDWGRER